MLKEQKKHTQAVRQKDSKVPADPLSMLFCSPTTVYRSPNTHRYTQAQQTLDQVLEYTFEKKKNEYWIKIKNKKKKKLEIAYR